MCYVQALGDHVLTILLVCWLKGGKGDLAEHFVTSGASEASRREQSERELADANGRAPEATD